MIMRNILFIYLITFTCLLQGKSTKVNSLDIACEGIVTVNNFPFDNQLYARNVVTNLAEISISGEVTVGNIQSIELRIFRENILVETFTNSLSFAGNIDDFSFIYNLLAERANYKFELYSYDGNQYELVKNSSNIVAGDAYIIDGQSNAEARIFNGSSSNYIDSFIRVYGTGVSSTSQPWHIAQGDGNRTTNGNTGQWGLVMANLITTETNIPVAIFNGAHGGTAISFHKRNDANPTDVSTNYGRLLHRLELTNLTDAVRGILWYQGESDWSKSQAYYETSFDALYEDWKTDFPNVEQFYTIQVRSGCGVGPTQMINIQEALRKQSSEKSDMKLMVTKGIATNGCHYSFENGYKILGTRLANLLLNDLYYENNPDAEAPIIESATIVKSDPSKIELTISGADTLLIDSGVIAEFEIPNNQVLSAIAQSGSKLILQLATPIMKSTTITYYDSSPTSSTPHIKDTEGIGLASFKNFLVESTAYCVRIQDGLDDMEEYISDGTTDQNSSDLELTLENNEQLIGLRFQNIQVPKGSTIESAFIQFTADEVNTEMTELIFHAEATDDATPFENINQTVSSRTITNSSVTWQPSAWNTLNESATPQLTSNLSLIIQEVVDRAGFEIGNDLSVIISGSGKRVADSYEGNPNAAAELCIFFTEPACNIGMSCDDNNPNTINDEYNFDCECIGENITLNAKILLEGFYDNQNNNMHTLLNDANLIPLTQPYNVEPWNYSGDENVSSIPVGVVDWILLVTRDNEGNVLDQAAGFINQAGEIMSINGSLGIPINEGIGNKFSIHHRSHLAVLSSSIYDGEIYDFTISVNQAEGNTQLKLVDEKYMMFSGDYDGTGIINSSDFNAWKIYGAIINQYLPFDGDGNGIVNSLDFNLWTNNKSKIGIPEIRFQ